MVLPSTLTAKLLKRGIISTQQKPIKEKVVVNYKGVDGCPNKYNIYHDCTPYCHAHWKGVILPDSTYIRRKIQMVKKYPLPIKWKEVFDKGTGRYYYWNKMTNLVSWLPPRHPKTRIGEPAAKIREKRHLRIAEEEKQAAMYEEQERKRRSRHRDRDRGDRDRDRDRDRKRYDDRGSRSKRSRRDDPVDPMDPSSYSDIPRGSWSDGLDNRNDPKTGADITASGPLYQQRPYPAPGAVLAANSKTKHSSKDK